MSEYPLEHLEVEYQVGSYGISQLEGKLLTLVDATSGDATQRKALKDLVRQTIWDWAYAHAPQSVANTNTATITS